MYYFLARKILICLVGNLKPTFKKNYCLPLIIEFSFTILQNTKKLFWKICCILFSTTWEIFVTFFVNKCCTLMYFDAVFHFISSFFLLKMLMTISVTCLLPLDMLVGCSGKKNYDKFAKCWHIFFCSWCSKKVKHILKYV